MNQNNVSLTAAEIGILWTSYIYDTMTLPFLKFMKHKVQDTDIIPVAEEAYRISSPHVEELEQIHQKENLPIPYGFTDKDVSMEAPDLFTDTFKLTYILHIGRVGMLTHSASLSLAARADIRAYFGDCLSRVQSLYQLASDVALKKGLYLRRPYIPYPKEIDFIHNKSYLSGLNPLTKYKQRILNAIEISHLSLNIETNQIGVMLSSAFMQTAQSKEVKDYMKKGKEISKKQIKVLSDTLMNDDIQAPISADHAVTDATTNVFSEKLMMNMMSFLSSAGLGNYATAASASQRSDLMLNYERLSAEIAQFAKDGVDIMIKNKWLEKPPGAPDRTQLGDNIH